MSRHFSSTDRYLSTPDEPDEPDELLSSGYATQLSPLTIRNWAIVPVRLQVLGGLGLVVDHEFLCLSLDLTHAVDSVLADFEFDGVVLVETDSIHHAGGQLIDEGTVVLREADVAALALGFGVRRHGRHVLEPLEAHGALQLVAGCIMHVGLPQMTGQSPRRLEILPVFQSSVSLGVVR